MKKILVVFLLLLTMCAAVFSEENPKGYDALWKSAKSYSRESNAVKTKKGKKELLFKSVDYARQAITANPEGSEGYLYLAGSLGKLTDFVGSKNRVKFSREIKNAAEKSIELNPSHHEAYLILGTYNRGVATSSWIEKELAKALFGGLPEASLEESERNLKKAIELKPDFIESHYSLALTYKKMKKKKLSKEELEKALSCPVSGAREEEIEEKAKRLLKKMK